ncbi:hypothetical protein [Streptomyces sp. CdTB01]|uniref:hypothetical protein n=1 Tax=Streptomyces sp. CdTB01 TaxID=1725411 RepID=UPI00073ADC0B|nr:hypothetical protein [Streptomyces sp. CdTB01]ALV33092.1 hypothetical protein AS200_14305 [Streptomyces sp. CdTB01]
MTIRTARGGGTTVRWVYGVFIALCAALAVLVHHETAAMGASPVMSVSSAMDTSSMSAAMAPSSMPSTAHAGHVMADEGTSLAWQPSSPNTADTGGCAAPGMQHCATASVDSAQLAVPAENEFSPLVDLRYVAAGRAPAGVVERAPPDLSVLSQLRI